MSSNSERCFQDDLGNKPLGVLFEQIYELFLYKKPGNVTTSMYQIHETNDGYVRIMYLEDAKTTDPLNIRIQTKQEEMKKLRDRTISHQGMMRKENARKLELVLTKMDEDHNFITKEINFLPTMTYGEAIAIVLRELLQW